MIFTDLVTVPSAAETIAHPVMVGDVMKVKLALVAPAGALMEAGTLKPVLVDFKIMEDALARAAVKVAVHVPPPPGATRIGEQVSRESVNDPGAVTVRVAVWLAPLRVAVTVEV